MLLTSMPPIVQPESSTSNASASSAVFTMSKQAAQSAALSNVPMEGLDHVPDQVGGTPGKLQWLVSIEEMSQLNSLQLCIVIFVANSHDHLYHG